MSDSNCLQVFIILPNFLDDFNNAVVEMVSTCTLFSKYSSPFTNPYGLVWFLLFNGISTHLRLFNAKAILLEEQ